MEGSGFIWIGVISFGEVGFREMIGRVSLWLG